MQRYVTLVRRCNGGIRIPTRIGFLAPSVAFYCAPVVQADTVVRSTKDAFRVVEYYSGNRISKGWQNCVKKGDVRDSRVYLINSIKLCASNRIFEKPEVKVRIAESSFMNYRETGVKPLTPLYNLLLRIYCNNNHHFVPTEFLQRMKDDECQPNMATFELLTEAYANQGKVASVFEMLEYIKSKGLHASEALHAAMVTGHSRAGDLEAAKDVIATMEAKDHRVHITIYTSLLCAYAERGLVEDIKKTHDHMLKKKVAPNIQTYTAVMDTLSKHGHGNLVTDILAHIENKATVYPDLRYICVGCLCRGEIEAPVILISCLAQTEEIVKDLLIRYFKIALESGLTLKQALEKVKQHIDIQPFKWMSHNIASSIVYSQFLEMYPYQHLADVTIEFPEKASLVPHPWGKHWLLVTREALSLLNEHKQLQDFHFYPLLARHCNDADIKELIKTFYMMANVKSAMLRNVETYVHATFRNAGITMDNFFSSQQLHEQTDPHWLGELLTFQCAHGKWEAATSTLEKMDKKADLSNYAGALDNALKYLKRSEKNITSSFEFVVALNNYGGAFSKVLLHFYLIEGKLNMDLFDRLLNAGVQFSLDDVIIEYSKRNIGSIKRGNHELWTLLAKAQYYIPTDDNVVSTLYKYVIKVYGSSTFGKKKSSQLYAMLSPEKKKNFDIQSLRVVQLTMMEDYDGALKEFWLLLKKDRPIPVLTWKRIVCAAYKLIPSVGDDLFGKMKGNNVFPDGYMLNELLAIHVRHKDITRAEKVLQSLEERNKSDVDIINNYKLIILLWAEHGNMNKILEMEKRNLLPERLIIEAKVVALLETKQTDQAVQAIMKIDKFRRIFLLLLIKMLIFNEHSLTEWKTIIMRQGVSGQFIDSMVFFTYVDCGLLDRAKTVLQDLKEIDSGELKLRMNSSDAHVYKHLFTNWGVSVPSAVTTTESEDTSKLMDSTELQDNTGIKSVTDSELKHDIDELCEQLNDGDSTKKENKEDVDF